MMKLPMMRDDEESLPTSFNPSMQRIFLMKKLVKFIREWSVGRRNVKHMNPSSGLAAKTSNDQGDYRNQKLDFEEYNLGMYRSPTAVLRASLSGLWPRKSRPADWTLPSNEFYRGLISMRGICPMAGSAMNKPEAARRRSLSRILRTSMISPGRRSNRERTTLCFVTP